MRLQHPTDRHTDEKYRLEINRLMTNLLDEGFSNFQGVDS